MGGNITNSADTNQQTISLNMIFDATRTISGTNDAGLTISGIVSGSGGLTKGGDSTVTLSGNNTYTGITTITQGTLKINTLANVSGGASSLGAPTTSDNGTIALNAHFSAVLNYIGTSNSSSDRIVDIRGADINATINVSSTGNLTFTSAFLNGVAGAKSLTLGGSSSGVGSLVTLVDSSSGALSVIKNGSGTWKLTGASTYTGATTLSAGTLQIESTNTSSGIANSASLIFNNSGSVNYAGTISGLGSLTKNGAGTLTLSGTNTYDGTNYINAGILKAGSLQSFGDLAPIVFADVSGAGLDITGYTNYVSHISGGGTTGGNITLGAADLHTASNTVTPHTYAGIISGTGGFYKGGTQDLTLTGASTYTGVTTIVQGMLRINTIKNVGGGASAIGAPTTAANGTIKFQDFDSTLIYIGTGDTSDRVIYCDTTVANLQFTIEQAGTGNFKLTSPFDANGTGSKEVILQGSSAGSGELSGIVADIPGGTLSVRKKGTGTWTLSGLNTYTGATTIETGGPLYVSGTINIASAVSVVGTLAGTGTINGPITVADTGTFHPGPIGASVGVMTTKGVTFNSTSTAMFDLNGATTPAADRITSSGTVALGAAVNTLYVGSLVNPVDSKVYTIISATTLTGTFNGKAEGSTFVISGRTLQISYLSNTVTLTDIAGGGGLVGDSVLIGDSPLIGTEAMPLIN